MSSLTWFKRRLSDRSRWSMQPEYRSLMRRLWMARVLWDLVVTARLLGAVEMMCAVSGVVCIGAHLFWQQPSFPILVMLTAVFGVAVLVCSGWALMMFFRDRAGAVGTARRIEEWVPELGERVSSVVEIGEGSACMEGISEGLIGAAIRDAEQRFAVARWTGAFSVPLRRATFLLAVGTGMFAVIWGLGRGQEVTLHDFVNRFKVARLDWSFVKHGVINIVELPSVLLRGESVTVNVSLGKGRPRAGVVLMARGEGEFRKIVMVERVSGLYETQLQELQSGVVLTAVSGDIRSEPVRIRAVDLPTLEWLDVVVEPPSYSALKRTYLESPTTIEVLCGTRVNVTAGVNNLLRDGALVWAEGSTSAMDVNGQTISTAFVVRKSGRFQVQFNDLFGFEGRTGWYTLTIMPDRSPRAKVRAPQNLEVLEGATVPIVALGADDIGLKELHVELDGVEGSRSPKAVVLGTYSGTRRSVEEGYLFTVPSSLEVGHVISYRAVATDNDTVNGPKRGSSNWFQITLVSAEHFLKGLERFQADILPRLEGLQERHHDHTEAVEELFDQLQGGLVDCTDFLQRLEGLIRELAGIERGLNHLREEIESRVDIAHLSRLATEFDWLPRALNSVVQEELTGAQEALQRLKGLLEKGGRQQAANDQRKARQAERGAQRMLKGMARALRRRDMERQLLILLEEATYFAGKQQEMVEHVAQADVEEMRDYAANQKQLGEHARKLRNDVSELKERMASAREGYVADQLGEVGEFMDDQNLSSKIDLAREALVNREQDEALTRTNDVAKAAHEVAQFMREALDDSWRRMYRDERDRLAMALRDVEQLLRQQEDLTRRSNEQLPLEERILGLGVLAVVEGDTSAPQPGPSPSPLDPMASQIDQGERRDKSLNHQQRGIRDSLGDMGDEFEWLMIAVPQLREPLPELSNRAEEEMERSETQLKGSKWRSSIDHQQGAAANLLRMAGALGEVIQYNQGVAAQSMGGGQTEVLGLAQIQERINQRTRRIHKGKEEGRVLNNVERRQLELMGRQEGMIRGALARAEGMFGPTWSPETRNVTRRARQYLRTVEEKLPSGEVGLEMQEAQDWVLAVLLRLANEMSGSSEMTANGRAREVEQRQEYGDRTGRAWKDWKRRLPKGIYGRPVEHGPPLRTVPEALRERVATGAVSEAKTMRQQVQAQRGEQRQSVALGYEETVNEYFKSIGKE